MYSTPRWNISLLVGLSIGLSVGCTSPTGTTKDSFEMTSSTSGRTWFTEDGVASGDLRTLAFTTLNFTVLKQEMARGQGEYVTSLGTLIGVPTAQQPAFGKLIQARYATLLPSKQTTPDEMLASLSRVMTGF